MKYEIKNGILYVDGKARFAVGTSYYPSFHEGKYQVPPDGDRIGEMKKDFRLMRESGIMFVRCAALAKLTTDGGEVKVRSEFIDEMAREAERAGLGLSIRLNGYFVNLSGNTDYEFINSAGTPMNKGWANFMYSCFFHEGSNRDNEAATKALAEHYDVFPSVMSYQIYNEPHYPSGGLYDYHPAAIAAYRKWLAEQGYKSEAEAEKTDPPRARPTNLKQMEEWALWRLFSMKALTHFLDVTAAAALSVAPRMDTYTCYTSAPTGSGPANDGVTYFDDAAHLTTLAFTNYTGGEGVDFFTTAYLYALAESAAAVYGKHAWCAELDARTHMPGRKLRQTTVELIGSGCKGVNYYEWRGDYPGEKTPLPDNCGFLHYNGTKADHFDSSVALIKSLEKYSEKIALAEKKRCGIAILHSDHAICWHDGATRTDLGALNEWIRRTLETYKELRMAGFSPDIVRAEDLADNRFGTRILFVPYETGLSDQERKQVSVFADVCGKAYVMVKATGFGGHAIGSWWDWTDMPKNRTTTEFRCGASAFDLLERLGETPVVDTGSRHLHANVLEGSGYHIVTLVNNDPFDDPIPAHKISFRLPAKKVLFSTPEKECELEPHDGTVLIPEVCASAILLLQD